ncbi:hypothetical protein MLT67_12295 [Escherichia coli]|uniref:hypothetical protein n=1 Tax=Escherichia fergusonii TaxID=564 RepID=UPI0015EA71EA|nr:hypothetical protein [Escherichia fergusonii]MBI1074401.1 hypothetical protein [Escherichia coli]MCN2350125.1 hypothetical protein [Escherichia coli]MCN2497811.1 hypothetical protein [Escherichia coli]QMC76103.1 hypothetical protein HVZ66_11370 [Escherichia fergusonii]HCO7573124.1 hypothetical protein [Escherichia fergusonii]
MTITKEQVARLRNDFECWQQDYDPVADKEQYDMFGLGIVAMNALSAAMCIRLAPVVPSTQAEAFIAAIEEEQERLFDEDYLMDSKDCIEVIREESKRWADTRRELEQPLSAQQAGSVSN